MNFFSEILSEILSILISFFYGYCHISDGSSRRFVGAELDLGALWSHGWTEQSHHCPNSRLDFALSWGIRLAGLPFPAVQLAPPPHGHLFYRSLWPR